MDRVSSNGSELDFSIDLESGGTSTTSEEDSKNNVQSCESSKNLLVKTTSGDCSCSYDKFIVSDEIYGKDEDQLEKIKEEMMTEFVHKAVDKEKRKKHDYSKPPRPPRGPSLDASDVRLLKEISDLNSKRKRMERMRTMKKIRKEKQSSSFNSNLFACLVTIVFFLVIIFQGLLGARM